VSALAVAIAFVRAVLQFYAKDPKLDLNEVEAIIGAINSAGGPRRDPPHVKLDVAQLDKIVDALARAGRQEPETNVAVSGPEKKGAAASSKTTK
jgi:hypothetical protein